MLQVKLPYVSIKSKKKESKCKNTDNKHAQLHLTDTENIIGASLLRNVTSLSA